MKKKLLITGCSGQLGREINRIYADSDSYELINTDVFGSGVTRLDITDLNQVVERVRLLRPYAILNCAAHTGVDACETERDKAFLINAVGPRNLSIAASQTGAKLVHISTDYVFAGDTDRPYVEFDRTDPKGVYGRTKLAGEQFVQQFSREFFIIRTAWLYGDGKNFVRTMLRLSETNDTVRVVGDQIGTPTSTKELARAIDALLSTENYGLFHGTCEGSCSWAEFAREIFRIAGRDTRVEAITTEAYGAPAPRPACAILENAMFRMTTDVAFAPWQDAVREYIREIL